ncbi:MAG: neutral/alkaline non-lysosomal ceramidase N-terminal domain-containing protein [Planctomycetes bacterium]|nr:neutral/alkaline non-lysosomal ceramidase N-terminal domain-containing protein [Planctomycetota bacterium]
MRIPAGPALYLAALALCLLACSTRTRDVFQTLPASQTAVAASTPGTGLPGPAPAGRPFRAGVATVDITPPVGVPLGGFGEPARRQASPLTQLLGGLFCFDLDPSDYVVFLKPSTGLHDPITARALVLDDGVERFVLVTTDLVATSGMAFDALHRAIAHLVPREHLWLSASHTHSGPGAIADKKLWQVAAMDCFDQRVFDALALRLEAAVVQAFQALEPARIGFGRTLEYGATRNRRGQQGVFDPQMGLIRVDRADGSPMALVVNFAIHGINLWSDNLDYSADNMGYMRLDIERRLPGCTALFLNGAEGDVNPTGGKGFAAAETTGLRLAQTALDEYPRIATTDRLAMRGTRLEKRFSGASIQTGCRQPGIMDFCSWVPLGLAPGGTLQLDESWVAHLMPFHAMRLNDVVLASVPGEPITDLGFEIKNDGLGLGYGQVMVVSLTNEHCGYIVTPAEWDRGGYEQIATVFGRNQGVDFRAMARRAMEAVR